PLESLHSPGEHPRRAVAEPERERQREERREEEPPLDEVDVPERVVQRRREQQHAAAGVERYRDLGVPLVAARDDSVLLLERQRGRERDPVVLDVAGGRALPRLA